jgi:hypothetical protein
MQAHLRGSPVAVVLAALLLAVAVRAAFLEALGVAVVSDGIAYMKMAAAAARGAVMRDGFGQIAFYSPGYPLVLAPAFALFGSTPGVAAMVNLVLGAASTLLVHAIASAIGRDRIAAALAAFAFALWIPSAYGVTQVLKENLSTPLLLGFVLAVVRLHHDRAPIASSLAAGASYGFGLLTGASSLLLALVFVGVAVGRRRAGWRRASRELAAFAATALLILAPWLLHTTDRLGAPVLTTNGGFNLYLGNNPAATGRFVSIADTPMGPAWPTLRRTLGEAGGADALARAAIDHAIDNPRRTIGLGLRKLALFWAPNVPDARDFAANRVVASARWLDVAQHVVIVALGVVGALALRRRMPAIGVVAAVIVAFWLLHGAAYIIPRYREPVMPLMIVLGSLQAAFWLRKERRDVVA